MMATIPRLLLAATFLASADAFGYIIPPETTTTAAPPVEEALEAEDVFFDEMHGHEPHSPTHGSPAHGGGHNPLRPPRPVDPKDCVIELPKPRVNLKDVLQDTHTPSVIRRRRAPRTARRSA